MSNEINKRIAMYRKLLGLSQAETAERMDMKSSTYSQMEREGSITCDRLLKLSEIFEVSPQYLLCGTASDKGEILRDGSLFPIDGGYRDDPPFILSKQEENYIKILRFLSKDDRKEVIQFLQTKYKESRK